MSIPISQDDEDMIDEYFKRKMQESANRPDFPGVPRGTYPEPMVEEEMKEWVRKAIREETRQKERVAAKKVRTEAAAARAAKDKDNKERAAMVAKEKAEKAAQMKADKLAKDVEKARKAQNQAKFEAETKAKKEKKERAKAEVEADLKAKDERKQKAKDEEEYAKLVKTQKGVSSLSIGSTPQTKKGKTAVRQAEKVKENEKLGEKLGEGVGGLKVD